MNKAQQALINLRGPAMRYTYDNIIFELFQGSNLVVSNATLCRIFKGAVIASPDMEKALVKVHNSLCKRGEKIK